MKEKMQTLLNSTGVSSHYLGYHYLIRSVELASQDPNRLACIQKEIYLTIAFEYTTTITSVERDIRTVRDVMMRNGARHLLVEMTGCPAWSDKTPYPKELISIFCAYLQSLSPPGDADREV